MVSLIIALKGCGDQFNNRFKVGWRWWVWWWSSGKYPDWRSRGRIPGKAPFFQRKKKEKKKKSVKGDQIRGVVISLITALKLWWWWVWWWSSGKHPDCRSRGPGFESQVRHLFFQKKKKKKKKKKVVIRQGIK